MEKYHYLNRITKKDLYRVLRYKYPLSFHRIAQRGQQHDVVIFQETIDLLEKYDQLLLMLKNDVEPTHLDWPNFTDTKRIEFYNWILSLKYPRNILPELDEIKFSVFRKISQYLGQSRESDLSAQDVIRNVNVYLERLPVKLCMDSYPIALKGFKDYEVQCFFGFLEELKPKVIGDSSISEQFDLDMHEETYEQEFKKVLHEHQQVYVLCLDIMIGRSGLSHDKNYDKLYLDYKEKIYRTLEEFDGLNTLIHYLFKLELSQDFGFNMHLVLILEEDKFFSETTFIAKLKNKLAEVINIFEDRLVIRNWNEILRKNFSKKAVGLIKNSDLAAINECWYWVFSYFFTVNQVIGFNTTSTIYELRRREDIPSHLITSPSPNIHQPKGVGDTALFANRKHLAKPMQQYLSYAEITYSEYSYLSTNEEEYLFLGNVLGNIEVFCETLKAVKSELFIIPQSIFGVFSPEEYLKISTRLGQMWLSLFTSLLEKEGLIKLLREAKFRSQNILSFMIFLKGNWQELQQLHNQQLNQFKIVRLNQIFSLLKNELTNHTLLESTRDLDNRLKKLTKYSRYLLARDVYILRFQIEFTTQSRYLNKTEQSSLLTEFLRVGQSAQPLCWLRGYLLRWDQHYCTQRQSRQTYADLTLCFEYQSKLQDVNLIEILKEYLSEFIARYNKKKKQSNTANEIDCSMLSCNVFSPKTELRQKVLKIETIDKELRKSFMKSYVPYFCFLDLFIVWVEMDNGKKIKRFTTGQKPKSKKIST
ncbi:hypothetical protein [Acinetobacter tandoii]